MVLLYITVLLLYIDCILVIRHPDNGNGSGRNMFIKNNSMSENIFINVYLLASYVTFFNARKWNI